MLLELGCRGTARVDCDVQVGPHLASPGSLGCLPRGQSQKALWSTCTLPAHLVQVRHPPHWCACLPTRPTLARLLTSFSFFSMSSCSLSQAARSTSLYSSQTMYPSVLWGRNRSGCEPAACSGLSSPLRTLGCSQAGRLPGSASHNPSHSC